jgi:purine-binding chemotaxis protein CheW
MELNQAAAPSQILRFELAGENYAFDVLKTREVLTIVKITPLPSSLDFLTGVINLRGSVIPVVDLRRKFGLPVADATIDTSIIIVEIASANEKSVIGAVVDAVRGVTRCEEADLEPPPRFGMQLNSGLIRAIAKRDGQFVVILDTDRVFSEEELWQLNAQTPVPAQE